MIEEVISHPITPKELELDLGEGIRMPFVLIPPGVYLMGSSQPEKGYLHPVTQAQSEKECLAKEGFQHEEGLAKPFYLGKHPVTQAQSEKGCLAKEGPQHEVRITKPFYLGKHPVTQTQYERVMGDNPSSFKGATLPVVNVSWDQAREFPKKLSIKTDQKLLRKLLRLPTEAEWEYACRAGTTTNYCSGDTEKDASRVAWYSKSVIDNARIRPVGEKEPNAFGLYDMHGNVWEWVEDDWHHDYRGAPNDGNAWIDKKRNDLRTARRRGRRTDVRSGLQDKKLTDLRVVRGGSWASPPDFCRSASREWYGPTVRSGIVGFRLLLDVE
jgi:formylglycine-generating enzyme required for sulfatase activity